MHRGAVLQALPGITPLLPGGCKKGSNTAEGAKYALTVAIPLDVPMKGVECVQVVQTLQKAQELGMTVMRMWAFADGPDEWNGLQPALGQLDEDVLR